MTAENWKAPGAGEVTVSYRILQFSEGHWVIEKTEMRYIAWFPTRGAAYEIMRQLSPTDAKRDG